MFSVYAYLCRCRIVTDLDPVVDAGWLTVEEADRIRESNGYDGSMVAIPAEGDPLPNPYE